MATTFSVFRVGRELTVGMFTDLGFPVIAFSPLTPYGWQIDLTENLTVAQIQRAKIRIGTRNSTQEDLFVTAMNSLPELNAIIATAGTQNGAELSAAVRTLAQDVKGLALWLGKDVIG